MPGGSSDTLYLFTYSFPFGTAETFLETEIDYLAAGWPQVVVLPARLQGERRPLPANVSVEDGLGRMLQRAASPRESLAAAAHPRFARELLTRPANLTSPPHLRRLTGQLLMARRTATWIEAYLRRTGAERPFCYSYWLNLAALGLARLRLRAPGMTFVSRAHGMDLYAERHHPPYLPLQRDLIAAADRVFTVSEHGRDYLAARHPASASRIQVARLGVNDAGLRCRPSSDGVWRVLSCSAMLPVKRLGRLVDGLAELGLRHPDRAIEWTHLGDGPERTRVEREAQTHLPANVNWRLVGHLPNEAVLAYYRDHPVDLLINVSESEGVPVSMMEAQSCGVPVVGTAVGGVPEIITPTSGVLLSPEAERGEIADAMVRICGDPGAMERYRDGARENWRARYNADRNYTDFVATLQGLTT